MRKSVLVVPAVLAIISCGRDMPLSAPSEFDDAAAAVVGRGISDHVTVAFGRDDVGSPAAPGSGHDASGHAKDKVVPSTIVLARGGTITFDMGTFHQVAIYGPGTTPEDVDLSTIVDLEAGPIVIPNFLIDDSDAWIENGPFSFEPMSWTSSPGTFSEPGRYLVICAVVPHFFVKMYAWVIVK